MKIGDKLKGRITGIQPYGAFVELETGDTGLIHISEIRTGFIENIHETLKVDEEVQVQVVDLDEFTGKASLSIRTLEEEKYQFPRRRRFSSDRFNYGFAPFRRMLPIQLFSTDIKIIQNREVFSYSVDSVLLSRFPRFPKKGLIVDFCAGNGAVGLFASTRTQAQILSVEIQERLADMAERSVRLNGLEEQMQVICDDLKNMPAHIKGSKVDMILCNPPYFKVDPYSNLNESEHYLLARHEITTNLEEICHSAQSILKSNGRLAMVHRPDRLLDILDTLKRHNLAPKRLQFVYPKREKEANMLLIEAIKDGSTSGFKVLPPLIVHNDDGSYTPEIEEIYYGS